MKSLSQIINFYKINIFTPDKSKIISNKKIIIFATEVNKIKPIQQDKIKINYNWYNDMYAVERNNLLWYEQLQHTNVNTPLTKRLRIIKSNHMASYKVKR